MHDKTRGGEGKGSNDKVNPGPNGRRWFPTVFVLLVGTLRSTCLASTYLPPANTAIQGNREPARGLATTLPTPQPGHDSDFRIWFLSRVLYFCCIKPFFFPDPRRHRRKRSDHDPRRIVQLLAGHAMTTIPDSNLKKKRQESRNSHTHAIATIHVIFFPIFRHRNRHTQEN